MVLCFSILYRRFFLYNINSCKDGIHTYLLDGVYKSTRNYILLDVDTTATQRVLG